VVGLEVLDNMPHDRFYFNEKEQLTHQAMVKITRDENGQESGLEEVRVAIADDLSNLFVELHRSLPSMDHISANKVLKNEGFFKRL
jgi:hypothetical protein